MPLPTVILPGYLAGAPHYRHVEDALSAMGIAAVTVPLRRRDWVPTIGGRSIAPILAQLHQTVQQVMQQHQTDQINLVGHSAGGWVARIYLGDEPYRIHRTDSETDGVWRGRSHVHTLITLGTPHRSQERWTKRNLDFVNQTYPGAFYDDVRYVCVAGKAILGDRRWRNSFTYSSYRLTCGRGDCWGDGITPVEAAHLEGAENLVLEGVVHSPRPGATWYGSPAPIQTWASYL